MLAVLLLALLDAPSPSAATVRTIPFATLTEQQTCPLIGKRASYRIELDSPETDLDDFHCFECRSADPADGRGVRFCPAEAIGEDEVNVTVEAELRVRRFGPWMGVPAFTQYELHDAVRVTPH
jgi:hypothetical protein